MRETKKVVEFRAFFNNYKIDLEADLEKYLTMKCDNLEKIQKGYSILKRQIVNSEYEVKGALHFLRDMGYVNYDKSYELFCEVTDYFAQKYIFLNDCEDTVFKRYIVSMETETA